MTLVTGVSDPGNGLAPPAETLLRQLPLDQGAYDRWNFLRGRYAHVVGELIPLIVPMPRRNRRPLRATQTRQRRRAIRLFEELCYLAIVISEMKPD